MTATQKATSGQLRVTCPNWERKEDKKAVNRMIDIFMEHVSAVGLGGDWTLELFKKTGGGAQDRILFKRLFEHEISGGKLSLLYNIRPFDRDSSWLVIAHPPEGADARAIAKRITGDADFESRPVQPDDDSPPSPDHSKLVTNQACTARIKSHGQWEMEVLIEDKWPGFIPLADICLAKYDRSQMKKHPIGSKLKVIITDPSGTRVECSTRTGGFVATDFADDVFTGIPDADGGLRLKGFHKKLGRVFDLLKRLAPTFLKYDEMSRPVPSDEIVEDVELTLMEMSQEQGYDVKYVDHAKISVTMNAICKLAELPEQWVKKVDDGFSLTSFGWSELGGKEKLRGGSVPVKPEAQPPSPANNHDDHEEAAEEAEERVVEFQRLMSSPDGPLGHDPKAEASLLATTTYISKLVRKMDLENQIEALKTQFSTQLGVLEGQRHTLEKWLEENRSLSRAASALHNSLAAAKP